MEGYIQTFIGVAVSVGLFILGYRQAVGAIKERKAIANSEVQKILLQIINDGNTLTIADVSRIIDGKARDNRVKSENLLSATQFLNTIFIRIYEDILSTPEQKKRKIKTTYSSLE